MDDTQRMREALAQAAIDGTLDDLLYPYIQRFPHPEDAPTRAPMAPDAVEAVPIIDDISHVPTVHSTPAFYTHMALLRGSVIFDAAGNKFTASQFQDGNWTRAYVRKTAPDGMTVLGEWQVPLAHGWKLDDFGISASGADLVVWSVGHDTPNPIPPDGRLSPGSEARIVGVFVPYGNQVVGAGAPSEFVQVQEGEPVDYEEVQRRASAALDEWLDTWIDPEEGTRQTLKNMVGDELLHLFSKPQDGDRNKWKVVAFQDVFYPFIRNAAAAVWYNVLRGEADPGGWNVARRNEFKVLIQEAIEEMGQDEPPKRQSEGPTGGPFPPMPDAPGRNGEDE